MNPNAKAQSEEGDREQKMRDGRQGTKDLLLLSKHTRASTFFLLSASNAIPDNFYYMYHITPIFIACFCRSARVDRAEGATRDGTIQSAALRHRRWGFNARSPEPETIRKKA